MPRATPENGLLNLASCSDGQRPIREIDDWNLMAVAVLEWAFWGMTRLVCYDCFWRLR